MYVANHIMIVSVHKLSRKVFQVTLLVCSFKSQIGEGEFYENITTTFL